MIKTILVLSDGTEIFAGHNRINAIQSTAIEESCNNGEDLTFGSVCSSKISVNIITPQNQLPIRAGEKITLYEELSGQMRKKGVFNAEKPQRKTANTTNVTAYDNVSLLDKDVTEWFNSLADFPYSLFDMAKITCEHCGLKLKNSNLRNGDFLINEMKLESVTARQILQWVGEVCGYFCIADENGDIFFSWYVENSKTIGINRERDTLTFFKGTLTYEDYTVKKIDRVQIRQSEDDEGFSYPSDVTGGNVYIIQSNPFIIASAVIQDIENVALNLYNVLKDIVYTPCRVSISSSFNFNVGDIIKITDANGVEISTYITKKNRAGNKETLQSSGNFERNGATQLYSTSFSKNYGDKLILQKAIAKLNVTADDQSAKIEALTEFQTETEKNIAEIEAEATEQGAKIGLVVETNVAGENAVKGAILVEAINGQAIAKISADVLDIEGKTLNIKVDATNINGKLTAKQINADDLKVKAANITDKLTASQINGYELNINKGTFDNCTINETCEIKGKLTGNALSSYETESGAHAKIMFEENPEIGTAHYAISLSDGDALEASLRIGAYEGEVVAGLYSEHSRLVVGDKVMIDTTANFEVTAANAIIRGVSDALEASLRIGTDTGEAIAGLYSEHSRLVVGDKVMIDTTANFEVTAANAIICGVDIKTLADRVARLEGA